MQTFISFDIANGPVFKRLLINKLLAIPTLGFYRFWGKTHLRRLLWQAMRIGDDRLVYHGTAKELFIGFLIAMVLLIIVFGLFGVLLQVIVAAGSVNPQMAMIFNAFSQFINFLLLLCFWQFARYRLWRFRLSRTSYRTIRFYQSGSALKYTFKFMLWGVLALISLGWLYPKMRYELSAYRVNNMGFGDQHFEFTGSAVDFFSIYWPVILSFTAYLVIPYSFAFLTGLDGALMGDRTVVAANETAAIVFFCLNFGLLLLTGILALFARVRDFNYVTSNTKFAGAQFKSDLPVKRVVRVGFVAFLFFVLIYSGISILFGLGIASGNEAAFMYSLFLFFGAMLFVDIILYLFLYIPLVKVACEHIYTDNLEVFNEVAASSQDSPKYGEGFADALDVGAF
ncbi:DUF898 family protein [Sneathiella limimaris]|uniref:DUF898 family protein n=1 Tax=Sneathiella limimaris TaxID=1964213 RepID=UPI00146A1731|nr:DUF898 family protein [Sneathiella limimaris]